MTDSHLKTPQRGRGLYPSTLSKGGEERRVPLHRRGTSRTYERLEDLLREAGYKETRVFTPEAERLEAEAEERVRKEKEKKNGLGTMVNFLAGLVTRNENQTAPERAQSLSRSTGKTASRLHDARHDIEVWAPPSPTPGPKTTSQQHRRPLTPVILASEYSSPSSRSSVGTSTTSSRSPLCVDEIYAPTARMALRHVLSTSDILRPPSAPPLHDRRHSEITRVVQKNYQYHHRKARHIQSHLQYTEQPPLPANWLHAVTRAVVGAGPSSGAYVGGPPLQRSRSFLSPQDAIVNTAVENRGRGLERRSMRIISSSTSTNRRTFTPHTPRAPSTLGAVTPVSVICRSAPGSRSSSISRKHSNRVSKKGKEIIPRVPSLGVTSVQNDSWPDDLLTHSTSSQLESNSAHNNNGVHRYDNIDSGSDDDELDFSRLLMPARRQHSIRSLRRHLHKDTNNRHPRRSDSATNSIRRVLRRSESIISDELDSDAFSSKLTLDEADTEDGRADWVASGLGLPGLEREVQKKRASMPTPWKAWGQA